MRPLLRYSLALLMLNVPPPPPLHAGANAGGSARLSWDPHSQVTDLAAFPRTGARLFFILDGVTDVASIRATLRWSPNSLIGPCYYVLADTVLAECGTTRFNFELSDSASYAIDLEPAPGLPPTCFAYHVVGDHCTGLPADFCLSPVVVTDSFGATDTLPVTSGATIYSGTPGLCGPTLRSVSPTTLIPGQRTELTLIGTGFANGLAVTLLGATDTVPAQSVAVLSPTNALATLVLSQHIDSTSAPVSTSEVQGNAYYTLLVANPDGQSATRVDAVQLTSGQGLARITDIQVFSIPYIRPGCPVLEWPSQSLTTNPDGTYNVRLGEIPDCPAPGPGWCGQECYHGTVASVCRITIALGDSGSLMFRHTYGTNCYYFIGGLYDASSYTQIWPYPGQRVLDQSALCPYGPLQCLWSGPPQSMTVPLRPWRDQPLTHVTFEFYAWGPWALWRNSWTLLDLRIGHCALDELTPLSGVDLEMENGAVDTEHMDAGLRSTMDAFFADVVAAGGSYALNSAYRTPGYQEHLREIWLRWQDLRRVSGHDCDELRERVVTEAAGHDLALNTAMPPARGHGAHPGPHVRGAAFDATVSGLAGSTLDDLISRHGLTRPLRGEPWHFQYAR